MPNPVVRYTGGKEIVYASTATTATHSLGPYHLGPANKIRGIIINVDVTAETDTAEVTPSLEVMDGNGDWVAIWTAAAAISATGNVSYCLYPAALNGNFTEVDGIPLPNDFRLTFTHVDTDSITYSVVIHWLR